MQKRIQYLDVARAIAIISITFNHAVNRSFHIYDNQLAEYLEIPVFFSVMKAVIYAFSRIGVPIFVMISGTLLLPRDYGEGNTGRFLKHNWLQLLFITEIWLAIMFWYKQFLPGSILLHYGIGKCLVRFVMTLLFLEPFTMGSMWYMEMILCVYLLIPVLAMALKKIDHKYFLIPMAIVTFCSFILPDVNGIINSLRINKTIETKLLSANVFSMYVVFLLLGYFITNDNIFKRFKTKTLIVACSLSFLGFCLIQFWAYTQEYDFVVADGYHSIFPMLVAVFGFELLKRGEYGKIVKRLSTDLSRISFGIYFVHICIMEGMVAVINHINLQIPHLWKFVLLEVISFLGAILIIKVLSAKKLVERFVWLRWINKNVLGIK